TDAARHFGRQCQNDEGSGAGGALLEQWNFAVVCQYLRSCFVYVRVFSADSLEAFEAQEGKRLAWALGDDAGVCAGALLWLNSGHACAVEGAVASGEVAWGAAETAPWHRVVVRGRSQSRSRTPPAAARRGASPASGGQARAGQAPEEEGGRASARDGVDAGVLARMTFNDLEALAEDLRSEGETGVPTSRPRVGGRQKRLGVAAFRTALAAYLGIDMSAVEHAGAAARSRGHAEEMLAELER
ncbi:MAG: hypothetical protein GY822_17555, partial [Deltaproteobacteria bacterium]|nr:hypothetical protein [Deltaproteobacteria bacterium]